MLELTSDQVLDLFSQKSRAWLTKMRKQGADEFQTGRGKWDATAFLEWWCENIYMPKNNEEIINHRERFEKERADKLELENNQTRSDLLPRPEVEHAFIELITLAKKGFQILPKSAPSILYGRTEVEMLETLERMVNGILDGMAEGATVEAIKKKINC